MKKDSLPPMGKEFSSGRKHIEKREITREMRRETERGST